MKGKEREMKGKERERKKRERDREGRERGGSLPRSTSPTNLFPPGIFAVEPSTSFTNIQIFLDETGSWGKYA